MKKIRFEAREVPDWAEPVDEATLQLGKIYFWLHYFDEDLSIPDFRAVVFVGREAQGSTLFQDVGSYLASVPHDGSSEEEARVDACAPGSVNHIFEGGKVIDELLKWSLRWERHHG
jgi:hypothetical protein